MPAKINLDPTLDNRTCDACGTVLVRRKGEAPKHWVARRLCSTACNGLWKRQNRSKRFWAKVAIGGPDDCWPWLGSRSERGYGEYSLSDEMWRAHRYALADQGVDLGDLIVLHSCDNPPCCNPRHLSVGTHADNNADMHAKGRNRHLSGSEHQNSKLTEEIVRDIRASNESLPVLSERLGVSKSALCNARSGKTWAHVQ